MTKRVDKCKIGGCSYFANGSRKLRLCSTHFDKGERHKWHYVNESDERCWKNTTEFNKVDPVMRLFTVCHKEAVSTIQLYTENKQDVTCMKCLYILNRRKLFVRVVYESKQ